MTSAFVLFSVSFFFIVLHLNLVHFKHLMHYPLTQIIAGIVEHRLSDAFSSQILLVNMLSFVVRTLNSYWGTQVRVALTSSILKKKTRINYSIAFYLKETAISPAYLLSKNLANQLSVCSKYLFKYLI